MQQQDEWRKAGEAFAWGFFLFVFGVIVVAIIRREFRPQTYPLMWANFGFGMGLSVVVLIGVLVWVANAT